VKIAGFVLFDRAVSGQVVLGWRHRGKFGTDVVLRTRKIDSTLVARLLISGPQEPTLLQACVVVLDKELIKIALLP